MRGREKTRIKIDLITVVFVILFAIAPTAEAFPAEVTGDSIDDEIGVDSQSVVIIDGATEQQYTLINNLPVISVYGTDHLFPFGHPEIAVKFKIIDDTLGERTVSLLYQYTDRKFQTVSDTLPGEIGLDNDGNLFGYNSISPAGFKKIDIPVPIIKDSNYLHLPVIENRKDSVADIPVGEKIEINTDVQKNRLIAFYACADSGIMECGLLADGEPLYNEKIENGYAFFYKYNSENAGTITFFINNCNSEHAQLTVFYHIIKYEE